MDPVNEQTIDQMVEAIVQVIHPEKIILFGSRAQGDSRPDSDVDFLVVDARSFGPERSRRKEMARIWRALGKFLAPVDILLYSLEEVEQWRYSLNHVAARALREGKVVYERQ